MMSQPRFLVFLVGSCATLAMGCVMSNPDWDPPGAASLTDSEGDSFGLGDDGRTDLPEASGTDEDGEHPSGDGEPSGDGDPNGDGDPSGDGDGGGGDGDGDGSGDGDGDKQSCGDVAPSFGPCPQSCDECHDGICWRTCGSGECHDDFMVCPVNWSCRFRCLGKDSCKDAVLACAGWGTCEVECVGESACASADVICAAGPCEVTCGGNADHKPCEHLDVKCGGDLTALRCDEPFEGAGPTLTPNKYNSCACASDCKPAH